MSNGEVSSGPEKTEVDSNTVDSNTTSNSAAPPLPPEIRAEIKSIVFRTLAVPAGIVSILIFLLGFFTREVGVQMAYSDAYKDASGDIFDLAVQVGRTAVEVEEASKRAAGAAQKAQESMNTIEASAALATTRDTVNEVVETLAGQDLFLRRLLAEVAGGREGCRELSAKTCKEDFWLRCPTGFYAAAFWNRGGERPCARRLLCCPFGPPAAS